MYNRASSEHGWGFNKLYALDFLYGMMCFLCVGTFEMIEKSCE